MKFSAMGLANTILSITFKHKKPVNLERLLTIMKDVEHKHNIIIDSTFNDVYRKFNCLGNSPITVYGTNADKTVNIIPESYENLYKSIEQLIYKENTMKTIYLKDFTRFPGGRFKKYGPGSGEEFRDEFIIPNFNSGNLIVDLDGVMGCCGSWVEETFLGLIKLGYPVSEVEKLVDNIISADQENIKDILKDEIHYLKFARS